MIENVLAMLKEQDVNTEKDITSAISSGGAITFSVNEIILFIWEKGYFEQKSFVLDIIKHQRYVSKESEIFLFFETFYLYYSPIK